MEVGEAKVVARRVLAGDPPPGYESLYAALLELRVRFDKPRSWYYRALVRAIVGVRRISEKHWLVAGVFPDDYYRAYNVWLNRRGEYECDCYYRRYGKRRRKSICTHVAAVILSRRQAFIEEFT